MTSMNLRCMTWNLHGKSLDDLRNVLHLTEAPPDILMLQELGGVKELPEGHTSTRDFHLGEMQYTVFLANPTDSFRCSALCVSQQLLTEPSACTIHRFGILPRLSLQGRKWLVGSLHFPHAQREDAVGSWQAGIEQLAQELLQLRSCDVAILGCDVNQDLHADVDEFHGMPFLRGLMRLHGLEPSRDLGPTWHARGVSSPIDFFLLRTPRLHIQCSRRQDLRLALPSDHDPLSMTATARTSLHETPRKKPISVGSGYLVNRNSVPPFVPFTETWIRTKFSRYAVSIARGPLV